MHESSDLLRKGLDMLRLPYTGGQINAFLVYLAELKKWNRAYNLTGLKTEEDIVIKHFLDSLLFLKVLPADAQSIADVGSGAGFPGIPIKIMRQDLSMVLIEPSQKKARFLEHVQRTLGIAGLDIMNKRIEDVEDLRVDAALTRALFSMKEFISKADTILKENGVCILSKGPKVEEELRELHGREVCREDIPLPFQKGSRHLVVIRKSGRRAEM
jgi:16S rRNA (guanine527-N7)-methyltransferase